MITDDGLNEIAGSILGLISHVSVKVIDKEQKIELYKTSIDGNNIKIYILVDETIKENISNIKLISKSNKVLIERPEIIEKDISKGLLLFFSLKVLEV